MLILFYIFGWERLNRVEAGNSLAVEKIETVGFRSNFVCKIRLIFVYSIVPWDKVRIWLKREVGHNDSSKNVLPLIKTDLNKQAESSLSIGLILILWSQLKL